MVSITNGLAASSEAATLNQHTYVIHVIVINDVLQRPSPIIYVPWWMLSTFGDIYLE